jgi:cysteine desulfurase
MIYLDHNATTPPDLRVLDAMAQANSQFWANPASQHQLGQRARRHLNTLADQIVSILGGSPHDQLIFTSGGTEANNLALFGLAGAPPGRVIISGIEHPSVAAAAEQLARRGFDLVRLPVSPDGVVQVDQLPQFLSADTRLISVMAANNETGVLQPVSRIVQMATPLGIPVHTDAVQLVGKLPTSFRDLGVAALTVSPHKFHGPQGIGGLLLRSDIAIEPTLFGGSQQLGMRPGTESVALAAGFAEALKLWQAESAERTDRLRRLRDRLETGIQAAVPAAIVIGQSAPRLPHTSSIAFPGHDRQWLLMRLDRAGIFCSTGSACASGSSEPSPVLLAMGCPAEVVASALRFSVGAMTQEDEIDEAIRQILGVVSR